MTCNWMTTNNTRLLLALVVSFLFLFLQMPVCAAAWQDTEEGEAQATVADDGEEDEPSVGFMESDEEDEDEEDDDEELVQNNPWGFDSRKLEAAENFWFRKAFAIEVLKIKSVCDLDKKQTLKLKIAVKGAAQKEFADWKKKWNEQMKQFEGMNMGGMDDDDDDDDNDKKKKKKKRKELVIENADEIDQETMQFLNNGNMFFGGVQETRKAIDSDFWRKTVRGVLEPEQFKKYESLLAQRKKDHIDAKISTFILKMTEDLGMTEEQAKQYDALVRPKMEKAPIAPGYYENFVFQYYATKYDKKAMKAVLDEDQLQMMKMLLGPSKTYGAAFDQQAGNAVGEAFDFEVSFGGAILEVVGEALEGISNGIESFVQGMAKAAGAKE